MDFNSIIDKMRNHPDAFKMGMIVSHLGIVRGTSRDGRNVTKIEVTYDQAVLFKIIQDSKKLPGIIDVIVKTNEGILAIGDPIMFVLIGGDIREHVFPVLSMVVERIKTEASSKKEYYD